MNVSILVMLTEALQQLNPSGTALEWYSHSHTIVSQQCLLPDKRLCPLEKFWSFYLTSCANNTDIFLQLSKPFSGNSVVNSHLDNSNIKFFALAHFFSPLKKWCLEYSKWVACWAACSFFLHLFLSLLSQVAWPVMKNIHRTIWLQFGSSYFMPYLLHSEVFNCVKADKVVWVYGIGKCHGQV